MSDSASVVPLGAWLAELTDDELVRLLSLRPDLAQPPPGSISALAARAQSRQSVKAATDGLDFLALVVLDALLVLRADGGGVPLAKLFASIGDRSEQAALTAAVDELRARALAWGDDAVRVAPEAAAGLPWHPGQVTLESEGLDADRIVDLLDGVDTPQRELLERLLDGSPIGRTRDAAPGTPPDRPVQRLLATGLLRHVDEDTVILPRLVGQVMRGESPGPVGLTPPDPVVTTTSVADVDAAAAGSALDLLREVDLVIEVLSANPIPELRAGGLGVRELKRLTKATGVDEQRLGLILELASAAGLIASGMPEPDPSDGSGPYWAPTVAADRYVEASNATRWHQIAAAWLDLPARPGLIGERGPDGKPYGALSDSLYSTAAPLDRRLLLTTLAELAPGTGVDAAGASNAMTWRRPRWAARLQLGPVTDLMVEAHAVGVIGRGAIATPSRKMLAGDAEADVVKAMDKALPATIDHFLLQADLTVVVPGPLDRALAEQLSAVASVESAGAAMVYRISEQSVRRALDTGLTASEIHTLFGKHSRTPVPQGLTYLIDDVARRHGQLRVGMAASFVRCEDPALLAQAISAPAVEKLEVRALAPTVAVSLSPINEVLAALRSAGFAPAAEDSSGTVVDIRSRGARVPAPIRRRGYRPPQVPSAQTLGAIVAVLRKVGVTPSDATPPRPGRGDGPIARRGEPSGVRGDRLRRSGGCRDPARGRPDQHPRRSVDGLRLRCGPGEGLRNPPRDVGRVGGAGIMGVMTTRRQVEGGARS